VSNRIDKHLVFIYDGKQYEAFLGWKKHKSNSKHIFCALTPFAIHYFEQHHIPFCLPSDFYQLKDYDIFRIESEKIAKELISALDSYYSIKSKAIIDFDLKIGSYFSHLLYLMIGSLHFNYFVLVKAIEKIGPCKVVVFNLINRKTYLDNLFDMPIENLPYILLKNSKYRQQLNKVDYIESGDNADHSSTVKTRLRRTVKTRLRSPYFKSFFVFNVYNRIRLYRCLSISRLRNKKGMNLLCIGGPQAGIWRAVFDSLRYRSDFDLYFIPPNSPLKPKKTAGVPLPVWEGLFFGLDTNELIRGTTKDIEKAYSDMLKKYYKCMRVVKKADILLYSVLVHPWSLFISHLAQSNNISTVAYQHGEMGSYDRGVGLINVNYELRFTDYYLCYGDGVNKGYSKYVGSPGSGFQYPVSVGSAALDNISSVKTDDNEYILYASCKYFFNYLAFVGFVGPYNGVDVASDWRLYYAQKIISSYLETLSMSQRIRVIWKLDPNPIAGKVPFETKGIEKIRDECRFVDLLKNASLIILDSPTTTCLEACTTTKPLFLYQPNPMRSGAKEAIEKRACIGRTPEELVSRVDEYIQNGKYPADVNNKEYIKKYGTFLDDGRSADRVIDFLEQIFESRR